MSTMQRGDELVALLTESSDSQLSESTAYDLLQEVFGGYPISRLQPLLRSDNEAAVKAGTWIVSELGEGAVPLIGEIDRLLDHSLREVRFDAVDAVHTSAGSEHGSTIAKAVALITDHDEGVQWRVLHFLGKATSDQLMASIPFLVDGGIRRSTVWLVGPGSDPSSAADVIAGLDAADPVTRLFAAAAAVRLSESTSGPLDHAAASSDEVIRSLARHIQEIVALQRPR